VEGVTTRKVVQAQSTKCQIQAPATISAWHVVADASRSEHRFGIFLSDSLYLIPITYICVYNIIHTHTHTQIHIYIGRAKTCNTNKPEMSQKPSKAGRTFIFQLRQAPFYLSSGSLDSSGCSVCSGSSG